MSWPKEEQAQQEEGNLHVNTCDWILKKVYVSLITTWMSRGQLGWADPSESCQIWSTGPGLLDYIKSFWYLVSYSCTYSRHMCVMRYQRVWFMKTIRLESRAVVQSELRETLKFTLLLVCSSSSSSSSSFCFHTNCFCLYLNFIFVIVENSGEDQSLHLWNH